MLAARALAFTRLAGPLSPIHPRLLATVASKNPTATFKTSMGDVTAELFMDKLPITCSNFADLAKTGFYDGLTFHRVIKGFMCQFGCPNSADPDSRMAGTGSEVARDQGGNIPDELVAEISNTPGKSFAPHCLQSSQIFINTKHNAFLGEIFALVTLPRVIYAPLLRPFDALETPCFRAGNFAVIEGMDVISQIESVATGPQDKPVEPVRVLTIEISDPEG